MNTFLSFLKNESGATAIEYGLIASLITVVSLVAFNNFGDATEGMYDYIETSIIGAVEDKE